MFHPTDFSVFQRLLDVEVVPQDIEEEYNAWQSMLHSCGHTGDLGPVVCVSILRKLGRKSPRQKQEEKKVDWRSLDQDGSVRIEAKFFGDWMPGVYLGPLDRGTLAIRLDGEDSVKEVVPTIIRLAQSQEPEPEPVEPPEGDEDEDIGFLVDLTQPDAGDYLEQASDEDVERAISGVALDVLKKEAEQRQESAKPAETKQDLPDPPHVRKKKAKAASK